MNDLDRIAHLNALIAANVRRLSDSRVMLAGVELESSIADCHKELERLAEEHDELLHALVPYNYVIRSGGMTKVICTFASMREALEWFDDFALMCDPAKVERVNAYTLVADEFTLALEKGE